MFYLMKDNLPFRRLKKERKMLNNSAADNTQMVVSLATSITDMADVVKGLAQQVTDLTALIAAQSEEDGADSEEDN